MPPETWNLFLIELEKIFFVGVEKKKGYSFDVESSNLSIYEGFGAFRARLSWFFWENPSKSKKSHNMYP